MRWNGKLTIRDELLFINVLSLALTFIVAFVDLPVLRVILGLPFVLFSPGYVLMAALFPAKDDLDTTERMALSLGFSVVASAGIGLVLSALWEVRLYTIMLCLVVFIAALSVAAWYRRRQCAAEDRPVFTLSLPFQGKGVHRAVDALVSILLAVAVIGAVTALAYALANPLTGETFTELYVRGAETLPREIAAGQQVAVTLGIANRENEPMSYSIQVLLGGQALPGAGPIDLADGETWEGDVTLPAMEASARTTLAEEVVIAAGTGAAAGTVKVESVDTISPGDHVMVGRESAVVQGIEGQSLVLEDGLRQSHPLGTAVVEAQKIEFRLYKERALDEDGTTLALWVGKERLSAAVRSAGGGWATYEAHARISRDGGDSEVVSAVGSPDQFTRSWTSEMDYPFSEMNQVRFSLYGDGQLLYETSETDPYPSVYLWMVVA